MASTSEPTCWLMKAEPEERLERGIDVSFGIDRFAKEKVTSWEGVRNHEAKKLLKEKMLLDQKALIYHSNTKLPGVAGTGRIVKEGYPDYNAWDPHIAPILRPQVESGRADLVDVEFVSKLPFFVPLKLLQTLASLSSPPSCTPYLTESQLDGIKKMALLNRGRLSVQPVEEEVYEAITALGTKGGWEELMPHKGKKAVKAQVVVEEEEEAAGAEVGGQEKKKQASKRKEPAAAKEGTRSSKRQKKA